LLLEDLRGLSKVMPVIYEFYALAFRNKTVRRVMQRYLRRYLAFAEPVIRRGMDSGEFSAGDARRAAIAVGAAMEGTLLLWAYAPGIIQLEEQLRTAMALILDGMERK
jgi:hypothetical protein